MSDPNAPRREDDPAEQPVEGFAVMGEQHASPSAPAAPPLGAPAQSFSSPAVEPAPQIDAVPGAPGQPAFSGSPADDAAGQEWQHGQHQPEGGHVPAADFGQSTSSDFGQPGASAPHSGAVPPSQHGQQPQHPGASAPTYGQSAPGQAGAPFGQQQYGQQPPFGAAGSAPQYGAPQYGAPGQSQYGAPGQPQYAAAAPMSPVDEKNAGMWGHLSGLSTIVTGGYGGWIGPLIVYMIYKDRSAFAKQESKEALNFGIFMTILTIGLLIVGTILSIVGIGFILLALWWVPGLLQVIFSIIGAMRVNNGGSYRYPFNWRLVK